MSPTHLRRIAPGGPREALHDAASSRKVEATSLAASAPFELMARAGAEAARLALALSPQAQRLWVMAGPGNNGGDALVAATWLHRSGRTVQVSWRGNPAHAPADALRAHDEARDAGVPFIPGAPKLPPDLILDGLLGLGQQRAPQGSMAEWIAAANALPAPILALDVPTGLCGDTGRLLGSAAVRATHTLALLTLKPGLFTGMGRDQAGAVWLSTLGVSSPAVDLNAGATAWLAGREDADQAPAVRSHASHKGSYGDLWVVGGGGGMAGAARLAARAGLVAGAGRVYVVRLDGSTADDPMLPELMHRDASAWRHAGILEQATVVCGCGGGDRVSSLMPAVLHRAGRLVLDADALNALAQDSALAQALVMRGRAGRVTVLTPHPLEAARLLGVDVNSVQADRLMAAHSLAAQYGAVVALKGSGTVVTGPGQSATIIPTGNARLATAGTGDVLAGWLAGTWSGHRSASEAGAVPLALQIAHQAAVSAAWWHGRAAEETGSASLPSLPLTASALIDALARTVNGATR